jgi:predicted MFS family arabinose efflux permease
MSVKRMLLLLTVIGVVSDSLLHPFYPQYLARVFGVVDPNQVGAYVAASSLSVLVALPGWALLSRRVPVFQLLIVTQLATALLSVAASFAPSLLAFYVLSLGMLVFKASYLLIYPHVLGLESPDEHLGTISLLAFAAYFSNIVAALLSGLMLQLLDPRLLFVAMAAGDLLQLALCLYLRSSSRAPEPAERAEPSAAEHPAGFAYKLGAVMLLMYFSAYLSEPFFSSYWQTISRGDNAIVTGAVFAIPGLSALLGSYVNARRNHADTHAYHGILPAIALCAGSALLQSSALLAVVIAARFAYGWGLFQMMVRLDSLLFQASRRDSYATEFSRINLFQGLGVLSASFTAGRLVAACGTRVTFAIAAGGFALGALLFGALFRHALWPRALGAGELTS